MEVRLPSNIPYLPRQCCGLLDENEQKWKTQHKGRGLCINNPMQSVSKALSMIVVAISNIGMTMKTMLRHAFNANMLIHHDKITMNQNIAS